MAKKSVAKPTVKTPSCRSRSLPLLGQEGQDEGVRQNINSESFFKHSHKVIVALTVQELLDEQTSKKSKLGNKGKPWPSSGVTNAAEKRKEWRPCASSTGRPDGMLKNPRRKSSSRDCPASRWKFLTSLVRQSRMSGFAGQLFVVRNPPMKKMTRHISRTRPSPLPPIMGPPK